MLKIKLAMAIIGISSIHLLRTFIEAGSAGAPGSDYTAMGSILQTVIRTVLHPLGPRHAVVDRMSQPEPVPGGAL